MEIERAMSCDATIIFLYSFKRLSFRNGDRSYYAEVIVNIRQAR